jgi:hypothetical protein
MAVEDKYVDTKLNTGDLLDSGVHTGKFFRLTEEIATVDDNGSVYRFFTIPSNAKIKYIRVYNDAITSGTDYDIGLYDVNAGAVIDKDLFADGLDLSTAVDARFALTAPNIDEIHKSIWEYAALSLTEDPQKSYDVALTANTVGSAAGTVTIEMELV